MARIVGILAAFFVTTALVVALVLRAFGPAAEARGLQLYRYRPLFERNLGDPVPARRPLVVWLGNSTIMAKYHPSYPQLLKRRLDPRGVDSLVLGGAAFDPYVYYFMVTRVVELEPAVVAIVAHLPSFRPKGLDPSFTYNDVSSFIRPPFLPRTFLLPLAERRLSPALLTLAQALNLPAAERLFLTAEGLRRLYNDAAFWAPLGPGKPPAVFDPRRLDALNAYDFHLTRRQPALRMLEATVRVVAQAGRTALVIASPIPVDALRARAWYDAERTRGDLALMREAVEGAGGTFLDLHTLLPQALFTDFGGHFGLPGAERLADAVEPVLASALARAEVDTTP